MPVKQETSHDIQPLSAPRLQSPARGVGDAFRRTRDETARRAIAAEYAQEVQRLIETGDWSEAPAFEDQLPLEWMPEAFFAYWCPDASPGATATK
jgi:hypothetical protein